MQVLKRNREEIARRAGREILITKATARNLAKPRDFDLDGIELIEDAAKLVSDPTIDVVCELIGGDTTTKELVLSAIARWRRGYGQQGAAGQAPHGRFSPLQMG